LTSLNERHERGLEMRTKMAGGDRRHFTLPGTDQLAPDLRRIIDECLFGSIWTRPGLTLQQRSICTISALTALGQLPLLRRHIERGLNLGLTPETVVEVFIQLTFYVGVPATEAALLITKDVFEDWNVDFEPPRLFDAELSVEELYERGLRNREERMGTPPVYAGDNENSEEMQVDRLITEYHWGAIHNRPGLNPRNEAICALASMTVLGRYDRQIRRRIEGALRIGMTPAEIMEIFIQVMLYGGYFTTRTAMQVARSVFTEQGVNA
jgi:4-carboxymuconolactone decarboxylase